MSNNYKTIWEKCLVFIQDNLNNISRFKTWFEPIKPLKLEGNILTIQVPSVFFYEWLEENYCELLKKAITKELGTQGGIEYSVIVDKSEYGSTPSIVNLPSANKPAIHNKPIDMPISQNQDIPNPFVIPGLKKLKINSQLIDTYSFDNFIEGDCNRLARSAGFSIADKPGSTSFNPLFIYGNTGLGKTHLAHAIGIQTKINYPDQTILYVTCEQFLQQFVNSVRNHTQNDFIHFYQMIDMLIVDDIHNLSGKDKTQDVFFQIFNDLHQSGKQLIITSDKAPAELSGIEPRLLSRFKWGLTVDLQVPSIETRIAILHQKLYTNGVEMPNDVIEYIAYNITTNIRELEGIMNTLLAQSVLNKKNITIELAKQMIDKFVKTNDKEISIEYIQKMVCDYYHVPYDKINHPTRTREIVQARQLSMYFAKRLTKNSLAVIGTQCGKKDHSTVLHACRTINNLIDTDKRFKQEVEEIERKIKSRD